ncbi:hypothetical protein Ahy_B04g069898 isoform B [Arachis hypogaea]|uniref:Uncharacterized protein n=1 Tax=Arachis hypogaea TaxID=3818 RepID=A0A444ZDV8_ARAHY|nr:hypothetical protein Ahy_B04g069898 isoform B [Arachis hypogaea]
MGVKDFRDKASGGINVWVHIQLSLGVNNVRLWRTITTNAVNGKQREKGESAHDAWKVGEESDSKPSAIDHARPSTAYPADAADLDLDVLSIAKEVAELVLWDLDSDFPYSSLNPMGNPSLSAPEPNESVWYAEASPSPEIGRKQTLLEDKPLFPIS